MTVHVVIPDTQAKPGAPTDHLGWIGQYVLDQFAGKPDVKVIHLGDHADMPSLSSYDRGKKAMEGRRYQADIKAANKAFDILCEPLDRFNRKRAGFKEKQWWPERHILLGNHEDRITRAAEDNAQIDGLVSLDHLNYAAHGWQVHPFLQPIILDGIAYAHYFYQPLTGRAYTGTIDNRLRQIGHSFTMGHQQTLLYGVRYVLDRAQHGLIAGACYLHEEDYKGPQGNAHWRGIVVCHEVVDGRYDAMMVSLDYLCRRFEGKPLDKFLSRRQGVAA